MRGKELSAALRSGQRLYGTCILSTSPKWPAAIASLGIDLAFIDSEHNCLDRDQLSWICGAYAARDVAPIVRIPEPDPYRACMVLDGGAQGVIVPYVETVAQVRELRGAVKLRPLKGERLHNALEGIDDLGDEVENYLAKWNRNNVLIVNIESQPALDNLEDIVAEPGLDAVLVGPHDLSINLGVPEQYDHPKFLKAISYIIKTARAAGVGAGIHFSDGMEPQIKWGKEGANLIMHSSDLVQAMNAFRADFNRFRQELGEDAKSDDNVDKVVI